MQFCNRCGRHLIEGRLVTEHEEHIHIESSADSVLYLQSVLPQVIEVNGHVPQLLSGLPASSSVNEGLAARIHVYV